MSFRGDSVSAFSSLVLGGVVFWVPETFLSRSIVSQWAWVIESFLGPSLVLVFCFVAAKYQPKDVSIAPSPSLFALVGLWLFAPWLMLLRARGAFDGMRFIDYAYLCLMSIFPPLTFWTSAMQGSAYGLMLATTVAVICHCLLEQNRWLIPPTWKRRSN